MWWIFHLKLITSRKVRQSWWIWGMRRFSSFLKLMNTRFITKNDEPMNVMNLFGDELFMRKVHHWVHLTIGLSFLKSLAASGASTRRSGSTTSGTRKSRATMTTSTLLSATMRAPCATRTAASPDNLVATSRPCARTSLGTSCRRRRSWWRSWRRRRSSRARASPGISTASGRRTWAPRRKPPRDAFLFERIVFSQKNNKFKLVGANYFRALLFLKWRHFRIISDSSMHD